MTAYLFIIDPIESLNIIKDSSLLLMKECLRRKIEVHFCGINQFSMNEGNINIHSQKIIQIEKEINYQDPELNLSSFFKKIFIRKDPPFDDNYLNLTYLLDHAVKEGIDVINNPSSVRNHNEKLSILNFKEIIPPTIVTSNSSSVVNFLKIHEKIVLKPINGMGGNGIFVIDKTDKNINSILETITVNETKVMMAQKYIPDITEGDKRIIVIKGEPLPFCLARIPDGKDFRANLAKGGTGIANKLTDDDIKIVNVLKKYLVKSKLDFVGIDVIGKYLTEINVTSPTCLVEIENQTNFNCAKFIIDAL
ncbi:glutathione synthase [Methylophilaceae bacterium]|nr:glutathione synthase [Methylophilaceae bacterium]|tara:strand:- start:168 stop:1088 length:921 start_codon:yes stop_codon:yes gene_type:complete